MTAPAAPEFVAKMAELSAAFRQRTAANADEFADLGMALSRANDAGHRARLQYLAHRLAGGSATFGLLALEQPASALETSILANDSAEEVGAHSRGLADAIRRICGAPP